MKQDTLVIVMLLISAVLLGGMLFVSTDEAHASGASSSVSQGRFSVATLRYSTNKDLIVVADNLTQKLAVYIPDILNRGGIKLAKNPIMLKKLFGIR